MSYPTMISQHTDYVLPAEWDVQSGVQMTWPHAATDWLPYLEDITHTCVEMARAIVRHEPLLIVVPDPEPVKALLYDEIDAQWHSRLRFFACPTNDPWARDHAVLTLVSPDGRVLPLDFKFNGWGKKFPSALDNQINSRLAAAGIFSVAPENHTDFVLEGGSIESDGHGTIFTTTQCLLASNRNLPCEKASIVAQLTVSLRANNIIWLDHGKLIGDDTDGHIDTIVRTAPNDTLLYIGCDDADDEQFDDFRALEQQLRSLRKADGKPYRLLRLPMPNAIFDGSERLPATYANFLIINGAVLCPTYRQPRKDAEAMETIAQAYPDREIIGIDSCTIIRQHGSIHCMTMQFPAGLLR